MARPLRLEFSGASWYAIGRSRPRRDLFRDDRDRAEFLSCLEKVVSMFRWRVSGYALTRNQYQLIVETPEPNLGRGMRQLNGIYTQYYQRRHGKSGAVLHGRYKSILVETDVHLLELTRFVMWVPVREGLARSPLEWRWSSCRAMCGLNAGSPWLDLGIVLGQFGRTRKRASDRARRFVMDGRTSGYDPARHVRGQVFLGGEAFRQRAIRLAQSKAGRGRATERITGVHRPSMKEILRVTADVFQRSERDIRDRRRGSARKAVAFLARKDGALRLPEVGRALSIREFSASHLASEGERMYEADVEFRAQVDRIRAKLGLV